MPKIYTHYDNLKVPRDASFDVIKKAYRSLAQKHHPDKNPNDPNAVRRLQIINDAYAVLRDPESRREYDQQVQTKEQYDDSDNYSHYNDFDVQGDPAEPELTIEDLFDAYAEYMQHIQLMSPIEFANYLKKRVLEATSEWWVSLSKDGPKDLFLGFAAHCKYEIGLRRSAFLIFLLAQIKEIEDREAVANFAKTQQDAKARAEAKFKEAEREWQKAQAKARECNEAEQERLKKQHTKYKQEALRKHREAKAAWEKQQAAEQKQAHALKSKFVRFKEMQSKVVSIIFQVYFVLCMFYLAASHVMKWLHH